LLTSQRAFDNAEGFWLDIKGIRLGLERPGAVQAADETFTFDDDYNPGTPEIDTAKGFGLSTWLPDGNCELAHTGFWPSFNGGIVAKDQSQSQGGSTQSLKLTYVAANSGAYRTVDTGIVGSFTLQGWARGDGTSAPRIRQNGVNEWSGATTAAWQPFAIVLDTANGRQLEFVVNGTTSVWFDTVDYFQKPGYGGKYNALQGLTTGALMDDDNYRKWLKALASTNKTKCTVRDIYNFFKDGFAEDAQIDVSEVGKVKVTLNESLIGEERALADKLAPVKGTNLLVILN
jgi:hypothetical protein